MSKHRDRVFRNGTRFPGVGRSGKEERAGVLEDVWRVSAYKGPYARAGEHHATGHTFRVRTRSALESNYEKLTVTTGASGLSASRYSLPAGTSIVGQLSIKWTHLDRTGPGRRALLERTW